MLTQKIVRLYESMHKDTDACLTVNLTAFGRKVLGIRECSLLEEPAEEGTDVRIAGGRARMELHFGPFEVKTLKISRE